MSHNITLSGVRYDDLTLLRSVVNDLSKGTAKLEIGKTQFRTYRGQPDACDHCITMPGAHDIGLKRNKTGSYDMVFDPYAMSRVFEAKGNGDYMRKPETYNQAFIGALAQEYLLRASEIKAAQSGYSTQRMANKDGSVSLVMERAA